MTRRAPASAAQTTSDFAFDGRISLLQPRDGYRFSIDAPLLVWFACRRGRRKVRLAADLGAGCGIVGIGLSAAEVSERVVAVEVQARLAALCAENVARNGLAERISVVEGDLREASALLPPGAFDLVVVNPPFWPADGGRLPSNDERKCACHEVRVALSDWTAAAARLLAPRRGALCAVFPARRLGDLFAALRESGLAPVAIVAVHPEAVGDAELVLVEARRGSSRPIAVEPPIFLRDGRGRETDEARRICGGEFSPVLVARADARDTAPAPSPAVS